MIAGLAEILADLIDFVFLEVVRNRLQDELEIIVVHVAASLRLAFELLRVFGFVLPNVHADLSQQWLVFAVQVLAFIDLHDAL